MKCFVFLGCQLNWPLGSHIFRNMRTWLTHNIKSHTIHQWTNHCISVLFLFFSFWNDMRLYRHSDNLTFLLQQIPTPGICDWGSRILHWNGSATEPLTISAWHLWIWHSYGHLCVSTCNTHHRRLLILWTSVARQVCYCHKQFRLDSKAETSQKACNSMYLPNLSYFLNWYSLVNKLLADCV